MTRKTVKLFSRYNRTNLVLTSLLFIFFSVSVFFVLDFMMVREVDKDLRSARATIQAYTSLHQAQFPDQNIDDVQLT